jgi:MoaA/NifB/PqqE/SkfB family radical SAM enzyme
LLDEINSRHLLDTGLHALHVSLWANTPQEYAKIYAGCKPDDFGKVVENVKRLVALKSDRRSRYPKIVLHQPITTENIHNIERRARLQRLTGCDVLSFSVLKTMRQKFAHQALSPHEEEQLRAVLSKMRKRLDSLSVKHNVSDVLMRYRIGERVWEKMPCYIPWIQARIKVDGTVLVCNPSTIPLGNVRDNSFAQIWNGEPLRQLRRKVSTKAGLAALTREIDCGFCCFALQNRRVHRLFRWLEVLR